MHRGGLFRYAFGGRQIKAAGVTDEKRLHSDGFVYLLLQAKPVGGRYSPAQKGGQQRVPTICRLLPGMGRCASGGLYPAAFIGSRAYVVKRAKLQFCTKTEME